MIQKSLKMSTAIIACLSISVPAPILAQETSANFPCVAPDGTEVSDPTMLSEALLAYLEAGTPSEDFGTCDVEAVQGALEAGGDDLAAAMADAPAEIQAQLAPFEESIAAAGVGIVSELATEVEAEVEAEAAPTAEAEAEVEAEAATQTEATTEAQTEPEPAVEAEVEAEAVVEAEAEVAPQAEVAPEPQTDPEVAPEVEAPEAEAEAEPAAEAEAEAVVEPEVVSELEGETAQAEAAATEELANNLAADAAIETSNNTPETEAASAEVDAQAEPTAQPAQTDVAATEEEAEVAEADVQSEVEAVANGAGEAGGEQLTDEERQALNQERESEAANTPPAAAAASNEGDASVAAEAEAEVETEVVTQTDVRRSDEDFETSAVGNAQATASAEGNDEDKGLSNFEKALLLGLGAAVVGSVLNNGDQVVSNSGDRVIIERNGELRVLKNDDELLRRPGAEVKTQTFQDGSTRTVLSYEDGSQIITVRANDGTVLRRTLIRAEDGVEVVLFDDTQTAEPINFSELPAADTQKDVQTVDTSDQEALRQALRAQLNADVNRQFSLQQVRDFKRVRNLAPEIELDQITFATGSAAIQPTQAEELRALGLSMVEIIENDPQAVFLVEGHTDAVGSASYNLSLSDRRAETVALALTEYFGVPPQNLITQGYGETDLKVKVLTDERANRRASVRNITRLLNRS